MLKPANPSRTTSRDCQRLLHNKVSVILKQHLDMLSLLILFFSLSCSAFSHMIHYAVMFIFFNAAVEAVSKHFSLPGKILNVFTWKCLSSAAFTVFLLLYHYIEGGFGIFFETNKCNRRMSLNSSMTKITRSQVSAAWKLICVSPKTASRRIKNSLKVVSFVCYPALWPLCGVICGHVMTSGQDITSPPSPPSSRVILQPWRWCQRRDPVSHRRAQWPHCTPLAALFSPELGGTMRPLSSLNRETGRPAVRCFSSELVCELNPWGEFV